MIPSSDAVVVAIAAASDALYVQKLDSGLGRLWRLPYDGRAASEVALPARHGSVEAPASLSG